MNPCELKLSNDLATLNAELKALKELMTDRHERYTERDVSNKERVAAAFAAAEKASEKTESALKEYKIGANEWRDTVKDLIATNVGSGKGMREIWGWIVAAIMLGATLFNIFWSHIK